MSTILQRFSKLIQHPITVNLAHVVLYGAVGFTAYNSYQTYLAKKEFLQKKNEIMATSSIMALAIATLSERSREQLNDKATLPTINMTFHATTSKEKLDEIKQQALDAQQAVNAQQTV